MVRGQQDSDLFHYSFEKSLVAVYHIIYNVSVADCFEVFPCAVNLGFFNQSKLHGGHRAFCLSNKIYVLDCTLIKSNSPVRIIVSYRCCNIEAVRQLHIDSDIRVRVQLGSEIALVCGIIHDMVIQVSLRFHCVCSELAFDCRRRKDIRIVMLI